jgi:hypothetical protein
MRHLLEQQAKLFYHLVRRRAEVDGRRSLLMEQLRALSVQLAMLRAMAAADAKGASQITGQIQAIISGVSYRTTGSATRTRRRRGRGHN